LFHKDDRNLKSTGGGFGYPPPSAGEIDDPRDQPVVTLN